MPMPYFFHNFKLPLDRIVVKVQDGHSWYVLRDTRHWIYRFIESNRLHGVANLNSRENF
jgi:hypothetical protein